MLYMTSVTKSPIRRIVGNDMILQISKNYFANFYTFILKILYAKCYLNKLLPMQNVTYTKFYLYELLPMQNVSNLYKMYYAKCYYAKVYNT